MTTRGQINSNFYQIVNVDANANPTEVKPEYITGGNVDNALHANIADVANLVSVGNVVGLGNIAIINLNNSSTNVLYGNGAWANIPPQANANYANFAGNSFGVNAAVANVKITGGVNGYVLQTDGAGNLSWTAQTGGGGNGTPGGSNTQVQYNNNGNFAGSSTFTFNSTTSTLTVTNIAGNGSQLTSLTGANVTGFVPNANVANIAYSVSVANVSGIGNIATINLDGNVSNILHGDGSWGPESQTLNANYANFAGNVTIAAQPNITSVGNLIGLQFNNTVTPVATPNIGEMFWDTGEHTVTLGMENGVKQQIGLESYIWVKASSAITNGQVVMWTGALGDNVTAAPANVAVAGFRAGYVLGVATQDIANNAFGYITVFGLVHGLNTNPYNAGDLLWLDPTVVGGLTATQPSAPNYQIQIATVTKKSGGDGHIQVIIRPEPKLEDISDVTITSPTIGQALVLGSGNVWINGIPNIANIAYSVSGSNVSGQVANALVAGTVYTNAQPNITSTGTLVSLNVTGTGNIGNLVTTKYNETVVAGGSVAGTITPDVASGTIFNYTLTGNITLNSLGNAVAGSGCTLILTQGGSGSYSMTSTMKFLGGTKTLSTSVGAIDIISIFFDGATYYASLGRGYT